ncbi:MAG: hypothetical protein KF901_21775 [Myxococcales bacterium]|nr:hypothetical protein [Myxococcales bacterium]
MAEHRLFVSQETLDTWMTEGQVSVDGEILTLSSGGQRFRLKTAVHVLEEIAGGGDPLGLIGRVKDVAELAAMGGEHVSDSLIHGDSAFTVVEGFLGEPIFEGNDTSTYVPTGHETLDRLARFFLGR